MQVTQPRFFKFISLMACLNFALISQAQTFELIAQYDLEDVYDIMADFGVPEGWVDIQHGADVYKVTYETIHPNGEIVLVTGAFCLPADLTCPIPLSSYQHGSTSLKTEVPGYLNGETLLGVIYASVGYGIVMPDFIGLGDSPGLHLYVHADSEAQASLDLIRVARDAQEELNFTWNGQLFPWGYSQGGHATMALHRMIETDFPEEFDVSACAPMSGPYDVSGEQAAVITSENAYPTPGYLPYIVMAYQEVYGNIYEDLEEVFLPEYAEIFPDLFDGTNGFEIINAQLPSVPSSMIQPDFLEAYENDPEHPMRLALQDNDVYDWAPIAPTRLYYCIGDDQVGYMNSIVALEVMLENGAVDIDAIDGGDFDHGGCAMLAMLAGLNFFENYREIAFDPAYEVEIIHPTASDMADGSVSLNVEGSTENWTYEWDDGGIGADRDDLLPGVYTIIVSNPEGCFIEIQVYLDPALTNGDLDDQDFQLYPNPGSDWLEVKGAEISRVDVFSSDGRFIASKLLEPLESVRLDTRDWAPGVYSLLFDGRYASRWVKK